MNNNRLSTNSKYPIVERELILAEVNELLCGPSNFELRNGRKWVISLNKYFNSCRKNICVDIIDEVGNILHSFDSKVECAKFLGVYPTTVAKRINKGIQFIPLRGKQVCTPSG
jgi:hypothetical protein